MNEDRRIIQLVVLVFIIGAVVPLTWFFVDHYVFDIRAGRVAHKHHYDAHTSLICAYNPAVKTTQCNPQFVPERWSVVIDDGADTAEWYIDSVIWERIHVGDQVDVNALGEYEAQ